MKFTAQFNKEEFLKCGALMSLPGGKLWVAWGEPVKGSYREKNSTQASLYLNDFFLEERTPWRQYSHSMEVDSTQLHSLLQAPEGKLASSWSIHQPEKFREAFESLKQLFREGSLDKGVPYLFARSSKQVDRTLLEHCLVHGLSSLKRKSGYLYGCWNMTQGILGLTPELLFSHNKAEPQKLCTMALAGTCSSEREVDSFLNDEKEKREHQLVVKGISEALQPLGQLHVGAVGVLKMPRLAHLMTPLELELDNEFDFDEIVKVLHPTPALGAFPRKRGEGWLRYMEQLTSRHHYGAPMGLQCPRSGHSHCIVAIRNMQWDSSGMRIGGGCGVVRESLFDREWSEVQLKIQSIKEQFQI